MLYQVKKTVEEMQCEGLKPDMDELIEHVKTVNNQLNELKVCGRDTLDRLLGCIMVLDDLVKEEE